jgi:predicted ribosome quality control (RQC) complex YloA/Tae2 family protein
MGTLRMWVGVVALLVIGWPCQAAEKGKKKGHGRNIEQRVTDREGKIDQRIAKIKERLEKHPNASTAAKTAGDRLITDLTTVKGGLEKLRTDAQAHNKSGVKADRKALRQDHKLVKADRKALSEALHAKKGKHRAGKKHAA